MAQSSAVPINNNKTSTKPGGDRPLVPPDERFWQRYSPHYELPISGVSSFAVHAVVLGLAAVIATFGWFMLQENKPIPMETVELPGGSGANPKGIGNAPGDGALPENLPRDQQPKPPDKPQEQPADLPQVKKSDAEPVPPLPADPAGTRAIDDSGSTARLSGLQDAASKKLMASLAGKGEGGSGSGGGNVLNDCGPKPRRRARVNAASATCPTGLATDVARSKPATAATRTAANASSSEVRFSRRRRRCARPR